MALQRPSTMPAAAIDAHCSVDRVREHEQVAQLARPVAHVVDQQRLGLEAERRGTSRSRLLVGDHLDDQLRQRRARAPRARRGARAPARRRGRAGRGRRRCGPRRRGSTSRAAGSRRRSRRRRRRRRAIARASPGRTQAATTSGSATSSFRNVRSASGMRVEEALERRPVAGLEPPDLHHASFVVGARRCGPRSTRSGAASCA